VYFEKKTLKNAVFYYNAGVAMCVVANPEIVGMSPGEVWLYIRKLFMCNDVQTRYVGLSA
jgi:hypothetical protein